VVSATVDFCMRAAPVIVEYTCCIKACLSECYPATAAAVGLPVVLQSLLFLRSPFHSNDAVAGLVEEGELMFLVL
jgi:hypothetical protein